MAARASHHDLHVKFTAGRYHAAVEKDGDELVDFDATFRAFTSQSHTLGPTPGAQEAWHRGRARYAVWAFRIDEPSVLARVADVGTDLGDAIEAIPAADLHVTAFVAGFPCSGDPRHDDDVPWSLLDEQTVTLRSALRAPLELEIGGANAFASCAFLDVHDPRGGLASLRRSLAAKHREIRFETYTPHVTVGRFRSTRATSPIAATLARHRAAPPIRVSANAIDLVTFDARHAGHAPLVTERIVRLDSTSR